MGLLDKARNDLTKKSLKTRAEEELFHLSTGGGLLKKALSSEKSHDVPPPLPMKKEEPAPRELPPMIDIPVLPSADTILKEAVTLTPSLTLPSQLLALLHRNLPAEKTALLLLDNDKKEYRLWASREMDQTTQHRLRLPRLTAEHLWDNTDSSSLLVLEDEDTEPLKPFVSRREALAWEAVILLPLTTDQELLGFCLLIPDLLELDLSLQTDNLQELWHQLAEPLGEMLSLPPRQTTTSTGESLEIQDRQTLEDLLTLFLKDCRQKDIPALILSLNYKGLLEALDNSTSPLDPYRFREILLSRTADLFGSNGEAYASGPWEILLFAAGRGAMDPQLLLFQIGHQLSQSLAFTPEEISDLLVTRNTAFPEDAENPQEILNTLFQGDGLK